MQTAAHRLSETRRQEIFAALVAAQDAGTPVGRSRAEIADRFDLTREEVAAVEREGIDKNWPPL